jgi:hypothetical protein
MEAVNHSKNRAMEADTTSKNGRSSKSQMSRGNFDVLRYTFLILVAVIAMTSCSKDGEKEEKKDTTFTFKYNSDNVSGVTVDVIIFEYNDIGEIVGQNSFDTCVKGFQRVCTANSRATKVKVRLSLNVGSSSTIRWVKQVFYLDIGKNVDIELKNDTIVGTTEP